MLRESVTQEESAVSRRPTSRSAKVARLEAVLLLAPQPQPSRKLAKLAGLADGTEARTLVRQLNRLYDVEKSAFRVEEVAGGFQLLTRVKFAPWLRRLHSVPVEVRLSAPAMETLAVVAYRQPVVRAEVEAVRGVQCGEILRQLIDRDLVKIVGRSEELGRPLLYGTTKRFLQVFGLRHLEELPRAELFRIAQPDSENVIPDTAEMIHDENDPEDSNTPYHSHQVEEEMKVKTAATATTHREEFADENAATMAQPRQNSQACEQEPVAETCEGEDSSDEEYDDDDDDEYYEEEEEEEEESEEDDDSEDETWEEVEDDEENEDDDWEDDDEDDEWEDDWEDDEEEGNEDK